MWHLSCGAINKPAPARHLSPLAMPEKCIVQPLSRIMDPEPWLCMEARPTISTQQRSTSRASSGSFPASRVILFSILLSPLRPRSRPMGWSWMAARSELISPSLKDHTLQHLGHTWEGQHMVEEVPVCQDAHHGTTTMATTVATTVASTAMITETTTDPTGGTLPLPTTVEGERIGPGLDHAPTPPISPPLEAFFIRIRQSLTWVLNIEVSSLPLAEENYVTFDLVSVIF